MQPPIKQKLSNYKEIEDNLMIALSKKFNFLYPLPKEVKTVDEMMLQIEWTSLVLGHVDMPRKVLSSEEAEKNFLDTFYELSNLLGIV